MFAWDHSYGKNRHILNFWSKWANPAFFLKDFCSDFCSFETKIEDFLKYAQGRYAGKYDIQAGFMVPSTPLLNGFPIIRPTFFSEASKLFLTLVQPTIASREHFKKDFWRKFASIPGHFEQSSSPNILASTCRMKILKVWKGFKIFQTFRKFSRKGLLAPRTHPNPQMKFLEKEWKFSIFSKIWFVGLVWVRSGCQKPVFSKFSETSKIFKYFT